MAIDLIQNKTKKNFQSEPVDFRAGVTYVWP